jgi:hypothetical protein
LQNDETPNKSIFGPAAACFSMKAWTNGFTSYTSISFLPEKLIDGRKHEYLATSCPPYHKGFKLVYSRSDTWKQRKFSISCHTGSVLSDQNAGMLVSCSLKGTPS